jgi:uncharacterized membrane protein YdjX (TVP38/TMEM64 family)
MSIVYYFAGLLTGASISAYFLGKELYKVYIKNKVQKKKLIRLEKLNKKLQRNGVL